MRHLFLLSLLLFAATAAQCSHDQAVHQLPDVSFELAADSVAIPMRIVDGRIMVDAVLDGKGPFPFIFDTGAQGSVMDLAFAREQGLKLGQEIMVGSPGGGGRPGNQVTIGRLEVGGLVMKALTSVAFEGMPFPKDADSPRGVLGPYGLSGLLVKLDYPAGRLVFHRGALPEPDEREVFGWSREQPLPEIPTAFGPEKIMVVLNSGASSTLNLPNEFADRLPLAGPLVEVGYARTVDQLRLVRGAQLNGAFTIGRYRLENPNINFVNIGKKHGNVGAGILKQFAVTIDPANRRLRLEGPADGILQVVEERKPRYGVQLDDLAASPLRVRVVDAGSPAAEAGLQGGDVVLGMNGRAIGEVSVDDRLAALRSPALALSVKRGGETLEISMELD
jgi:hypothetical protein